MLGVSHGYEYASDKTEEKPGAFLLKLGLQPLHVSSIRAYFSPLLQTVPARNSLFET